MSVWVKLNAFRAEVGVLVDERGKGAGQERVSDGGRCVREWLRSSGGERTATDCFFFYSSCLFCHGYGRQ